MDLLLQLYAVLDHHKAGRMTREEAALRMIHIYDAERNVNDLMPSDDEARGAYERPLKKSDPFTFVEQMLE